MSNKSGVSEQVISLPKGGGALKGIGEKFSADLHTGTGNFTVPIDLPAGRNDFGPELSLTYSTGNGNSAFGQGWQLSIPGVSRKTSAGVPEYNDTKDVFILSGAEDLVRVERKEEEDESTGERWTETIYKPRTEGLFARIIRYQSAKNDYWKVLSKDGLVSTYGTQASHGDDDAVIADPVKREKVFAWRLTQTRDPFGNQIVYEYEHDTGKTADEARHWDQSYLKRIQYVDIEPETDNETRYLVSVEFAYEERPDSFSDYSPGFEARTRRRCKEITVKTHADREGSYNSEGQRIRGYELFYQDEWTDQRAPLNGVSLLSRVEVTGYKTKGNEEETQSLPPLEFGYSEFDPRGRNFDPVKGEVPTRSLANPDLELADVDANGLPDIVEMNGSVRYWRNLGNGEFDEPRMMREAPPQAQLTDPGVQMMDFDGNAKVDLMVSGNGNNGPAGFFSLRPDGGWDRKSFQRFKQAPSFSLEDPEAEPTDLTGNGSTDVIRSGSQMEHFFSDREEGWNKVRPVSRKRAEAFPDVSFSDQRVRLAGVSGGGLQDIVLVHDGNVEYWPNLGHGNWGRRIHMRNSPRFPYGYDPRRILLGDVNGDGCADLVYVDNNRILLWINKSGNAWSERIEIKGTPSVSDMDAVRLVDLKGSGIQGVLWSADARGSRYNMFFLDFTDGTKPYVLNEMDNHMGAVTRVKYEPSTRFYLDDQKKRETRWRTSLPFPVQVVSQVESIDRISENKLTTVYRYHHGYWDGEEREFRGFGFVEQEDTTTFNRYNGRGLFNKSDFEQVDSEQFSPPTLTKTWFHQGPIEDAERGWREVDYSDGYWSGDIPALSRPEETSQLLARLRGQGRYDAVRDALRSLRGRVLRTELYAIDGGGRRNRPYTVTESMYGIRKEEAEELLLDGNKKSRQKRKPKLIFFPSTDAQRTTQWERGDDPMTQLTFTGVYDEYGQPQVNVSVAVPRGHGFLDPLPTNFPKPYLGTYTITEYAKLSDDQERKVYIHDRVCRSTVYELPEGRGSTAIEVGTTVREEVKTALDKKTLPTGTIVGQTISFYDGTRFRGASFGKLGETSNGSIYGALTRTESLVLTEDVITAAYPENDDVLSRRNLPFFPGSDPTPDMAAYPEEFRNRYVGSPDTTRPELKQTPLGYGYSAGTERPYIEGYYTAIERRQYDFQISGTGENRGLVRATCDPLGNETRIEYDTLELFPKTVTGPTGLQTRAEYDYRSMQPEQVIDPNDNRTAMQYTPHGLPESIAVMGKDGKEQGDTIEQPGTIFQYDFSAFERGNSDTTEPISVHTIKREQHRWDLVRDNPGVDPADLFPEDEIEKHPERFIQTREYSDGFGRLMQTRTQAEDVVYGDERFGNLLLDVAILVRKNGSFSPQKEDHLRNHSVGLSVDPAVSSNAELRRFCEDRFDSDEIELKSYLDESALSQALRDGEVDAIALDDETASAHPTGSSPIKRTFTINVDRVKGRKVTAEAPQVTVSGWQTYDNKGQVVEKYEPFFDTGWGYLSRSEAKDEKLLFGQSVHMFYDPLGRVIRTVNPDGSQQEVVQGKIDQSKLNEPEKYEPSPWEAYTYDANDNGGRTTTAVEENPRLQQPNEYRHHWNTPSSLQIDALGRTISAVERTRDSYEENEPVPPIEEHRTETTYDIRGNVLTVIDALDRTAFEYTYDLSNTALRTENIDAGLRAVVFDAAGNEVERRDSKGARVLRTYDELNRPSRLWAKDRTSEAGGPEQKLTLREQLLYGENTGSGFRGEAIERNLLGQFYIHHDEAGKLSFTRYDFKGNVLEKDRRVVNDESLLSGEPVEWTSENGTIEDREQVLLESRAYETSFEYDALNRQTKLTYPEDVEQERKWLIPSYNRAGSLEEVTLKENGDEQLFVDRIAYNARGQRSVIAYGNGVLTRHSYDRKQFRLSRMRTETYEQENDGYRTTGDLTGSGNLYQNFTYGYDLVGNITSILDQTPNCGVKDSPRSRNELLRRFGYDPLYQLIYANGRECTELLADRPMTDYTPCGYRPLGAEVPNITRENAPEHTSLYWERYDYNEAGNMGQMRHGAQGQGREPDQRWTRDFTMESGSNRLINVSSSPSDPDTHTYDKNGNLLTQTVGKQMVLDWDHADRLRRYQGSETDPSPEAFYCYDSGGQRVKKVVRKNSLTETDHTESTIYVDGRFEHHSTTRNLVGNNTLHVMDDQKRIATVRVGAPLTNRDTSPDVQYQYDDHLGSSTVVVNGDGKWFSSEEYSPYGETTFGGYAQKRYRYLGKERDEESGLYYYGARYYASWLARWISAEPRKSDIGLDLFDLVNSNTNLYEYVDCNPLRKTDQTGFEPTETKGSGGFFSEVLLGEFHEGESSWAGTGANVVVGLIPVVGQLADLRDTVGATVKVVKDPSSGQAWTGLGLAIVGWVPLVGDTIKGAGKVGRKVVGEAVGGVSAKGGKETVNEFIHQGTPGVIKTTSPSSVNAIPSKGSSNFTKYAAKAFSSNFSETPALKNLWETAAQGLPSTKEGFKEARGRFWKLVNEGTDEGSQTVRDILTEAGYELQGGAKAPLLKMKGWDKRGTREVTDRRLSIDHVDPQSANTGKIVDSSNLRFMSQRDNSFRGDRFDVNDQKIQ